MEVNGQTLRKTLIMQMALLLGMLFSSCTYCRHKELHCAGISVKDTEAEIKELFQADSVQISILYLKEEVYFPTLIAPQICIFTPKQLPDGTPLSKETICYFDEDDLYSYTSAIVDEIIGSCSLKNCNDFLVEYKYYDDYFGHYYSHKIIHYDERLNNKKPKD